MILVKRKLFRMVGLLFPGLYLLGGLALRAPYDRIPVLILLALFIGWMLYLERWRFRNPKVNRWLFEHFKGFTKEKEREKVSTTTFFLIAAALTILLFPRGVAIAALLFLTVGDPAAEIIGVNYGRVKILRGKTLEGTLAGAAACLLVGLPLLLFQGLGLDLRVLGAGAAAAALTELLPFPVDDNFTIPLGSGIVMVAVQALALS
ncbi:MAG TPA: SEC59/DGK1/VTE5 family protein [Candidatus Polarisedimenticolia bacterium]|nr:SEC59/DGK1/VTE5 family protein [Candidatus Polarisedimenticolia bacterium]